MFPDWPSWVQEASPRLATWTHVVGASTSGNSITKTAITAGFDAGGASVETLAGDGWCEFSTSMANTDKMAGLTHAYTGAGFTGIDYAFYLSGGGTVAIYEAGVNVAILGVYVANDVFRIQIAGSTATYWQNGALVFTSVNAPTLPLFFQTSIFAPTADVSRVQFTP